MVMRPEEVPAALVEKACRARISAQWGRPVEEHEWAAVRSGVEEKWMAEALAAVLPEIQAQAKEEIERLNGLLDEFEAERERLQNDCGYLADAIAAYLAPSGDVPELLALGRTLDEHENRRLTATTEETTT